jgi:hypothetical protein
MRQNQNLFHFALALAQPVVGSVLTSEEEPDVTCAGTVPCARLSQTQTSHTVS